MGAEAVRQTTGGIQWQADRGVAFAVARKRRELIDGGMKPEAAMVDAVRAVGSGEVPVVRVPDAAATTESTEAGTSAEDVRRVAFYRRYFAAVLNSQRDPETLSYSRLLDAAAVVRVPVRSIEEWAAEVGLEVPGEDDGGE